jgi:tocopherol O-methyltransferase
MMTPSSTQQLARFYESKTRTILSRYGPGPRVHYHTGIIDEAAPESERGLALGTAYSVRAKLVAAQERLLNHAAEVWNIRSIPFKDVLDVGCGLGGGAIFWAQQFSASVTAITIAPSHLSWVAKFAAQAGVQSLVQPLLCDACQVPGTNCFDAAVAIESCSSFPREPWFERMWALLRFGGHVLIADLFLENPAYRELVNQHWFTQIGTIDEYLAAARRAGFREGGVYEYSQLAEGFWTRTCDLLRVEGQARDLTFHEQAKLSESLQVHCMMRRAVINRGLRYALLSIAKR